jgi:hypothetical protein
MLAALNFLPAGWLHNPDPHWDPEGVHDNGVPQAAPLTGHEGPGTDIV